MSDAYGMDKISDANAIPAPELDYRPPIAKAYRPKIGLIGCGGITTYHLDAYQVLGLEVAAFCDSDLTRATARRDAYNPDAKVYTDYRELLKDDAIEIIDAATHPDPRVAILEASIDAGKHILSQKPFVEDLDVGRRLCDRADAKGVKLAVNQNGRWAPHFAWINAAIRKGCIGQISSIDFNLQWDHTWTAGTPFEAIHHLLLYDFGIHWFDITNAFLGGRTPTALHASVMRTQFQQMKPPFLAQVMMDFDGVQVRMSLNAHVVHGQEDRTIICGEKGTLRAWGPELNKQQVGLWTEAGAAYPALEGNWFESGFQGTMGELVCAIEEDRQPFNNARDNLKSLSMCFEAMRVAD
ncbi:MAG: putative dehydrogenase [Kiritimatiellia bacterium]|jgi:predicted dehydrogenase